MDSKIFLQVGDVFIENRNVYETLKLYLTDKKKQKKSFFQFRDDNGSIIYKNLFKMVYTYESSNYVLSEDKTFILNERKIIGGQGNIFYYLTEQEREDFREDILTLEHVEKTNYFWFWPISYFHVPPGDILKEREDRYFRIFRRGIKLEMTFIPPEV
jgi:hypothetical protein